MPTVPMASAVERTTAPTQQPILALTPQTTAATAQMTLVCAADCNMLTVLQYIGLVFPCIGKYINLLFSK
jgi:hypothetical protein